MRTLDKIPTKELYIGCPVKSRLSRKLGSIFEVLSDVLHGDMESLVLITINWEDGGQSVLWQHQGSNIEVAEPYDSWYITGL